MNAEDAIATLRRNESALRARGVAHAAVFGSVARGANHPDSDLDILVEFEPGAEGTMYDYIRFKEYVGARWLQPAISIAITMRMSCPAAFGKRCTRTCRYCAPSLIASYATTADGRQVS
jgi:hypothetical protein